MILRNMLCFLGIRHLNIVITGHEFRLRIPIGVDITRTGRMLIYMPATWTLSPICNCGSTLQWRHDERDGVSNHQPRDCLPKRLFRRRSKKTSKLRRITGLCEGNSPMTGEFRAQRASNAENGSIWWRHHELQCFGNGVTVVLHKAVDIEYVE